MTVGVKFLSALISILICAGCSLVNTHPTDLLGVPPGVQNGLSYFLPKQVLRVVATRGAAGEEINLFSVTVPDQSLLLETGMALSPLSDDDVKISTTPSGFLAEITAIATDRTAEIAEALTRVIFSPGFRAALATSQEAPKFLVQVAFDPLDHNEILNANAALKKAKSPYCIEVELYDGTRNGQCGVAFLPPSYEAPPRRSAPMMPVSPGVYYRREINHKVHIYSAGRLYRTDMFPFANGAPLHRIDIDRTLFVKRETTIVFEAGQPTSVSVKKPSEALGLAQLPLKIIGAAIEAPLEPLQKRLSVVEEQKKLLDAEAGLTESRAKYLDAMRRNGINLDSGAVGATVDARFIEASADRAFRTSQVMPVTAEKYLQACRDWGLDKASCVKAYRDYPQ